MRSSKKHTRATDLRSNGRIGRCFCGSPSALQKAHPLTAGQYGDSGLKTNNQRLAVALPLKTVILYSIVVLFLEGYCYG